WYVNYCCRDDFGTLATHTSAWAGIHYFASRKGRAANANSDVVLTWPAGNGWLAQQLRQAVADHIRGSVLVANIALANGKVKVLTFDASSDEWHEIVAEKVVVATPQFVNQYLLPGSRKQIAENFEYAPWMVANLTINGDLNEKRGEPLAWDNVIYQSQSLGYVNANHQHLSQTSANKKVLTYYLPLPDYPYNQTRLQIRERSWDTWIVELLSDLSKPHPNIRTEVEEANVWIWGHGMISPPPGFIFGEARRHSQGSVGEKIFFAHSDLSGISIFEEAFYWGTKAALDVIDRA
ncbi:MAG: FAD-dependent oxidoreductase, partial [Flammeovirgaceae bacterium]